jgi:hypothetical protein
MHIEDKDRLY